MNQRVAVGIVTGIISVLFLVSVILALNTVVDLDSTDLKSNLEKAYLEGYTDVPFHEAVESFCEKVIQPGEKDAIVDYTLVWEEGWHIDGAPEYTTGSDEKKVTFCINNHFIGETESMYMFFVYNEKNNTLYVHGSALDEANGKIHIELFTDASNLDMWYSDPNDII